MIRRWFIDRFIIGLRPKRTTMPVLDVSDDYEPPETAAPRASPTRCRACGRGSMTIPMHWAGCSNVIEDDR